MSEAREWMDFVQRRNAVETAQALSEKSPGNPTECLDTADGGMVQYAPMREKGDLA